MPGEGVGGLFSGRGLQHWGINFGVAFLVVLLGQAQGGRDGCYEDPPPTKHQQRRAILDEMLQQMDKQRKGSLK